MLIVAGLAVATDSADDIECMKQEIEQALQPLVGLPLTAMHRSRRNPGWERFEFGEQCVSCLAVKGSPTCGQYFIHAVCGWRVAGPQGIAIGAFDYSNKEGEEQGPEFREEGAAIRDLRGSEFFRHVQQSDLVVQEISADSIGSVHFKLTSGYYIDLLPIDSLPDVQWRLMDRQGDTEDFIVTGEGIERGAEADGAEPFCSATLIVTGEDLKPEAITALLGLTPDQAWRRGEHRSFTRADGSVRQFESIHNGGGWKRFIPAKFQNEHLDDQLAFWAEELRGRSVAIYTLAEKGFAVELNCCIVTGTSTVVQIPAEQVRQFAAFGVDISVTFYPRAQRGSHLMNY